MQYNLYKSCHGRTCASGCACVYDRWYHRSVLRSFLVFLPWAYETNGGWRKLLLKDLLAVKTAVGMCYDGHLFNRTLRGSCYHGRVCGKNIWTRFQKHPDAGSCFHVTFHALPWKCRELPPKLPWRQKLPRKHNGGRSFCESFHGRGFHRSSFHGKAYKGFDGSSRKLLSKLSRT